MPKEFVWTCPTCSQSGTFARPEDMAQRYVLLTAIDEHRAVSPACKAEITVGTSPEALSLA